MTEHKVTLEQMLDCRERRVERQKEARLRFGAPVVSITLVWPGEVKDSLSRAMPWSRRFALWTTRLSS